jgi:hypothetical protein
LLIDTDLVIPAIGADQNKELYILAFDGYVYWFKAPATSLPGLAAPSLLALAAVMVWVVLWRIGRSGRWKRPLG